MADNQAQDSYVSPPAGIGSSPGMGESFRMNLGTGQGTYTYKLQLPAGVLDQTPRLVLQYTHGSRADIFGFGWTLPLRAITRRLDLGPESSDETFLDNELELAELLDGSYAARQETAFARYTRQAAGWKIEERDGHVHTLGVDAAARVEDPDHPGRTAEWLCERSEDANGNGIDYTWRIDNGFAYPAQIAYAIYAVRFVYEDRPDVRLDGRGGFLRRLTKRCSRIDLFLDPGPGEKHIRSWSFTYDNSPGNGFSLLASVQMSSFDAGGDAAKTVARRPVRFTYGQFDPGRHRVQYFQASGSNPPALDNPDAALVAMDSAPLPGVLSVIEGRQYYWRNNGRGGWDAPRALAPAPLSGSLSKSGVALADMDGAGRADLMLLSGDTPVRGYYENAGGDGWGRFVMYPRAASVNPEWASPRLRLTDNDGDGRIDAIETTNRGVIVWRNLGEKGWADPTLSAIPDSEGAPAADFSDPNVRLADMTGDGTQDIVRVTSGGVWYWPNLGNGRYGAAILMHHSPRLRNAVADPGSVLLLDVDGDGCADLVEIGSNRLTLYSNRGGQSFGDAQTIDPIPSPIAGSMRPANALGHASTGLIWNSIRGGVRCYVHLEFDTSRTTYLLTGVDNGAGLIAGIDYRSAVEDYLRDRDQGAIWTTDFPFPLTVVASTTETDQVTGQVTVVEYRYHEAHYQRQTRQFQGFRTTERIERGDESRPDSKTVFHFLQQMERQPGNGPQHAALNGSLVRTEVYALDGSASQDLPFQVETATHDVVSLNDARDGQPRSFVFVTGHRTEDHDRTADVRAEEKTYTYDAAGNVVREVLRASGLKGGAVQAEAVRTTDITYAVSATRRILDRHASVVVRDGAGKIVSETRSYYDGAAFAGMPLGQMDRGQLMRESRVALPDSVFAVHYAGMDAAGLGYRKEADADGVESWWIDTKRYSRDARGIVLGERDPVGNDRTFEYDAAGVFKTALTDAIGATQFDVDRAVGQPAQIRYADGTSAQFKYDAQGRVLSGLLPGDDPAHPPRSYEYDDAVVPNCRTMRTNIKRDGSAPGEVLTYFTGRGEEFQHRAQSDAGQYVVSGLRRFNPWGDLKEEFEPVYSANRGFSIPDVNGKPSRKISYDPRGRVVQSVNFNGGISTAAYAPFAIVTSDANDNDLSAANVARGQANTPHREEMDVFRRRIAVVESIGGGVEVAFRYELDEAGRLIAIRDDAGIVCSYTYDLLGNRLSMDHRAAGQRKLYFNAKGQVARSVDAGGNDLRIAFDSRGRMLRLATGAGAVLEDYTYDDLAKNALGRLALVTYPGGSQSYRYDTAGRTVRKDVSFSGGTSHSIGYEYDYLGRETAASHTGGLRVEKSLTLNGWVSAITGVLSGVTYNARGLPERISYANGVTTDLNYLEGPGRTTRQRTTGPAAQVYEDITYDLDKMGLLLGSNDTAPGNTEAVSYTYDPLYQIRGYTADDGAGPVSRAYDYVRQFNLATQGETNAAFQFDDAAHPDRISGGNFGGGPQPFAYDSNGNLRALPGKTLQYNVKNELSNFTGQGGVSAAYAYDHEGFRVSKTVDDGHGGVVSTFFVGREVEIRSGNPAVFVTLGGRRVGILRPARTDFVHTDHAGNTRFFTDGAGTKIAAIAYRPFGNIARSNGVIDSRTYGYHPFDDETGFYYMKRRYYSPELGRFLTPDPLSLYQPHKFLSNPKALHPYAYAGNDPLNHVDPEGLSFWSVFGAVVGAIVGVVLAVAAIALIAATGGAFAAVLIGIGAALLGAGIVGVSYAIASANRGTAVGEFFRGFMIGFNAGANAVIATALFGPVIGVALGVINFLAAFDSIAGNRVFQGILGWSSWLMPMSWLVTAVGLVFYVFNLVMAGITFQQWDAAKISSLSIDWSTGTLLMEGGLIRPAGGSTGFNMGHFVFLSPGSTAAQHELGHTLNLAAYGWAFHYIGALDENVFGGGGNAISEVLADSHDPARAPGPGSSLDQWDPAHT